MESIPVVFISDNNFVAPTMVAISSFVENISQNVFFDIYVICMNVEKQKRELFKKISTARVRVHVMNLDHKYANLGIEHAHVSKAALFKFDIPNIFSNLDKILYLDGDVLIKGDLSELFNLDISDVYLAGVRDMAGEYMDMHKAPNVKKYFNSGVMLMNLKKMRQEKISDKLIKIRKERTDFVRTMDQDVLNYVLDENVLWLDIQYNVIAYGMLYLEISIDQINEFYGVNFASYDDLLKNSKIIHFASKKKPWLNKYGLLNNEWFVKGELIQIKKLFPHLSQNHISEYERDVRSVMLDIDCEKRKSDLMTLKNRYESVNGQLNKSNLGKDIEIMGIKAELERIYSSREWQVSQNLGKNFPNNFPKEK